MKFNEKLKKMLFLMIVIVLISLIATGIIVSKLMKDTSAVTKEEGPWFFQQSLETGETVLLDNAFIVSAKGGKITFIHKNETYTVDGKLAEDIYGIADLSVDGKDISKITLKPDTKEGVLTGYTENTLMLDAQTNLSRNQEVPVYKVLQDGAEQTDWSAFMIGVSKIKCVMQEGQVAAILLEEEVTPQDARVVIKNGDGIFYNNIYVKKVSDQTLISAKEEMQAKNVSALEIADAQGMLLCDANGNSAGEAYEGSFRILQTEQGLVLINIVDMETYLKYVLPSEMPASFEMEALKAQAVCARTYAYAQMHNASYAAYGANMDDSTAFQVYHKQKRSEKTNLAVEETEGEVVSSNGALITCYYYSTSPGVTSDFSVWGPDERDYIAVMGLDMANQLDLSDNGDFSNYIRNTYDCYDTDSPYYRWQAKLDTTQAKDAQMGLLQSIDIKQRNDAGYAIEVLLNFENGQKTLVKEGEIRSSLGSYLTEIVLNNESVRTDFSSLPSACFEVLGTKEGQITLQGGGFGHGIGLSQYGANSMAKEGFGYKEIVEYYYRHVAVKKIEA
uniref:SpoIID/LytB domain-containing protein n=1 Tax=Agathobacter sp. TaxID=2021311 RepID=UPI00405681B4